VLARRLKIKPPLPLRKAIVLGIAQTQCSPTRGMICA
jgi:hypothetical protein